MKNFTRRPNKPPQWSLGDRVGSAWPTGAHGRACAGLTGPMHCQEASRWEPANPMTNVELVLTFPWGLHTGPWLLGGQRMGRAVSPRNLQGKDPHWLICFGLSEMPAAPALLEAAASSASISIPLASAWPLQLILRAAEQRWCSASLCTETKPAGCRMLPSSLGMEARLCRQASSSTSQLIASKSKHPTQPALHPLPHA